MKRMVLVEWVDPRMHDGWGEIPTKCNLACFSAGFLVATHKDRIVVAQNYSPADDCHEEMWGDYIVLPKKQVVRITTLRQGK